MNIKIKPIMVDRVRAEIHRELKAAVDPDLAKHRLSILRTANARAQTLYVLGLIGRDEYTRFKEQLKSIPAAKHVKGGVIYTAMFPTGQRF